MIHVDADACNDSRAFERGENARALLGLNEQVVGPAQVAGEIGGLEDRFARRQTERQRHHGQGVRREVSPQE